MKKEIYFYCEAHNELYEMNEGCPHHFKFINFDELFEISGGVCWAGTGWCMLDDRQLAKLRGKKHKWFANYEDKGVESREYERFMSKHTREYRQVKEKVKK